MQHLCLDHDYNAVVASNFKWKDHRQSLILFILRYLFCVTYLFDLELILKFLFSFVIYIKFSFLLFIQNDLEMRRIEAIKTNKRATTCNSAILL